MYKIGLTGGIASGKSTVAVILREMGVIVIDADVIAHRIIAPGQKAWHEIVDWLGGGFLLPDGSVNRKQLGEVIFADQEARRKLEAITHPLILCEIDEEINKNRQRGTRTVILDIPLLIECGWQSMVDEIWLVYVRPEVQLKRLQLRNGYTLDQALARIQAQLHLDEKRKFSKRIIDNSGNLAETNLQIKVLSQYILT